MGSYRYFGEITPSGHKGALNPHGWSEGSATVKNIYNIEYLDFIIVPLIDAEFRLE